MKTKFKLLIVLLATFCVTLVCGLVAACIVNDPPEDLGDPATDGYVITVLFPDGSPVTNKSSDDPGHYKPTVELTDMDGNRIAKAEINASGVAAISYYEPGEYYIKVTNYLSGYYFDNTSVKTSADKAFYTVSLSFATNTAYTVNLKYPDKSPISNVTVKLIKGTQTVATAITNENGVATTHDIVRGDYRIVLENLPAGYGYRPASATIAAKPVDITAVVKKDIDFTEAKLTEDEIEVWNKALNAPSIGLNRFNTTADCYAYTAHVGTREEVFYTIHAPKTGAYTIGSKKGNNYVIQFYTEDLGEADSGLTISSATNNGNNVQIMRINEGETLNFSVKSEGGAAGSIEILICLPVPTAAIVTATAIGEYTLTFDGINEAILNFDTDDVNSGIYTFTSLADEPYDLLILEYVNSYPMTDDTSDLTGEYKGYMGNDNGAADKRNFLYNKNLTMAFVGGTFQYHVIIKGELIDHPVQIKVKIERTGNAIEEEKPEIKRETAVAHVDTKYENQEGNFRWMPTGGSLTPVKGDDGYYYVEVNGVKKALVVAITKELNNQEYSFATIEYLADGQSWDKRVNEKLTVYEDMTKLDTTWNYTNFIDEYKKYVNKDGVYHVNEELKQFLERYMNQYYSDFVDANPDGSIPKPAQPWLLGCGYYA